MRRISNLTWVANLIGVLALCGSSMSSQQAPSSVAAPATTAASQSIPASQSTGADKKVADETPTLTVNVEEVNLIFTVTDKHGEFIPNLKQSDFALLDNGRAPAKVSSFSQQVNLPLRVGIVLDTSSSIQSRFRFEQQASTQFLLQIMKSRRDRAFVMGFDVTPNLTQDWTNNLDALQVGVNRLRPGGGTALFDAVYIACRDKLLDASREQEPVRRAMVLLSDGDDIVSHSFLDDAIKMCQRSETIIYAISTNWTPSRGKGDAVLKKMTDATGGRTFFPPSVEEVSNSFHDIEQELRSQYALTYSPADFKMDGSFRTIYLISLDRHYQVRARKGYFAPRE